MNVFVYKITFIDPDTGEVNTPKGITYATDYVEAVKNLQLFYGADSIVQIDYLGIADEEPVVLEDSSFKIYLADL